MKKLTLLLMILTSTLLANRVWSLHYLDQNPDGSWYTTLRLQAGPFPWKTYFRGNPKLIAFRTEGVLYYFRWADTEIRYGGSTKPAVVVQYAGERKELQTVSLENIMGRLQARVVLLLPPEGMQ